MPVLIAAVRAQAGVAERPVGPPEPIAMPQFPRRLHAVVWRNRQLVFADR